MALYLTIDTKDPKCIMGALVIYNPLAFMLVGQVFVVFCEWRHYYVFYVIAISSIGTPFRNKSARQASCSSLQRRPWFSLFVFSCSQMASRLSKMKCCASMVYTTTKYGPLSPVLLVMYDCRIVLILLIEFVTHLTGHRLYRNSTHTYSLPEIIVNSPGIAGFVQDGCSSNLWKIKPTLITALIISLIVYFR